MEITASAGSRMVALADRFISLLEPDQSAAALRQSGKELERRNWDYVPRIRTGLSLMDMTQKQRKTIHRLMACGLSFHAYAQVVMVMGLEDVLDEYEGGVSNWSGLDYAILIFGTPGQGTWAWRIEGHHISLNYSLVDDQIVSCTPLFLGSHPAVISHAGSGILQLLAREELLARELVLSLNEELRAAAVVRGTSPIEIRTGNLPMIEDYSPAGGIRASQLKGPQSEMLRQLIGNYLERLPREIAEARSARLWANQGDDVIFWWEGSLDPGQGHYYSIVGPDVLIEYDNTQHDANHIHSVYRNPANDFGDDVLGDHLLRYSHVPKERVDRIGDQSDRAAESAGDVEPIESGEPVEPPSVKGPGAGSRGAHRGGNAATQSLGKKE